MTLAAISAIDWIALFLILASLVLAMWRGFVYEMLLLIGWVLAFVAARFSAAPVGGLLPMGESSEPLREIVGFLLVFIVVAFICGFLAARARRAILLLGVRPVDRLFGAVFGLARGVALLLLLTIVALKTPVHEESWWHGLGVQWLVHTLDQLRPWLPFGWGQYL